MDTWSEKFTPVIEKLLKIKKTNNCDELDFLMSKLDLKYHKTKVFDVLTELYYCDCCKTHQLNKPCIPVKWVSLHPPSFSSLDCMCDCRHIARMICRMCD